MCHPTCVSGQSHCQPICAQPEVRVLKNGQVTTRYHPRCETKCPQDMCEMDACPSCEIVCRQPPAGYTIEVKVAACAWQCTGGDDCEIPPCIGTPSSGGEWVTPRILPNPDTSFLIIFLMIFIVVVIFFSQVVSKKTNFYRKNK